MTSCSDWLTVYPNNDQTTDQFWRSREEVEGVLANGYVSLRDAVDYLFVWGEVRGNSLSLGTSGLNYSNMQKMNVLDITPSNPYASWASMYTVIKMANSVIKYAPGVVDVDDTFFEEEMNSYLAEAYWLRSLAYFYLIRVFKEVPFVTEPYVKDDDNYETAKSTEYEIMEWILEDLHNYLQYAKEEFSEGVEYTKGRATKWAFYALMADIYLWKGDYARCIEMIEEIEGAMGIALIRGDNDLDDMREAWFSNFGTGNTSESIFEIQHTSTQTNNFIAWFSTTSRFQSSYAACQVIYEDGSDLRTRYNSSTEFGNGTIRKYTWSNADGSGRSIADQNYIIYRLAEIYLMKAEALALQGSYSYTSIVENYINPIRSRANATPITRAPSTEEAFLRLILNERQRELYAEGKYWFDLLRIGKRNKFEQYHELLIEEVLKSDEISAGNLGIVRAKLKDTFALYMPITTSELDANPLLEQNPYYKNLGY